MEFIIGLLPGLIAGAAMAYALAAQKEYRFSTLEKWILGSGVVAINMFLLGPMGSYFYSLKFARVGAAAIWEHGIFLTVNLAPIIGLGIWYNKNAWKPILLMTVIIILALGWLTPLLFNLVAG